ncbi:MULTISPECIES: cytochrome c [unclassified Bradyrhizobium]|uniref:c-type cytochrome n=1 Tax=unclassified Bradyrhizobium TaxID=2631580 RepID=UPI002915C6A0|nr:MULTISPECIES: cytochrome c [unclassified Bradyrhizobium]
MSKSFIVAMVAQVAILALTSSIDAASPGMAFKSVTVDLPFGDRTFPGGASADAINNNCLACHSVGMVLRQPPMSRKAWTAIVDKMRNAYKAPVADADVASIIDYLVHTKGTEHE